jgi:DNA-binding transcriptional LysR family regulator
VEALSDELEKQVRGGAGDLALTALSPGERLPHKVLSHQPYMLFVGTMHLFAGRRTVGLAELDRLPFVLRQCCERLGSGRRLLDAAHVRFKVVAKTRQEATAAALVVAGTGCTLAPKSWLRPGLRPVKVEGLSLERTVGLMWKTKTNEGRAAGIAKNLGASMIRKVASACALTSTSCALRVHREIKCGTYRSVLASLECTQGCMFLFQSFDSVG